MKQSQTDGIGSRNVLDYAVATPSFARKAILAAVLGLVGTGVAWWQLHLQTPTCVTPTTGGIWIDPLDLNQLPPDTARQLRVILEATRPCADDLHEELRVARDRALQTLADAIDQHRGGIEPFIEDLQSFSSKIGLVGRAAGDSWNRKVNGYDSNYVRSRVEAALRWHVISDDKLKQDIQAALEQFASDVEAAKARYYARVQGELEKLRRSFLLPTNMDISIIEKNLRGPFAENVERIGRDTASSFITATITGFIIEEVAERLLDQVLGNVAAQFATRAATIFAVSGGATITTSAGGAGAGMIAGPAGTVGGFIGGIVIGMAIDWWFDQANAARIGTELQQLIDAVKAESLKHTAATLDQVMRDFEQYQQQAVFETVKAQLI